MFKYNPFYEELEGMSDIDLAYHEGYDAGYAEGSKYLCTLTELEKENEALRNLLGANVRVMKAEIRKEIEKLEEKENTDEKQV